MMPEEMYITLVKKKEFCQGEMIADRYELYERERSDEMLDNKIGCSEDLDTIAKELAKHYYTNTKRNLEIRPAPFKRKVTIDQKQNDKITYRRQAKDEDIESMIISFSTNMKGEDKGYWTVENLNRLFINVHYMGGAGDILREKLEKTTEDDLESLYTLATIPVYKEILDPIDVMQGRRKNPRDLCDLDFDARRIVGEYIFERFQDKMTEEQRVRVELETKKRYN